jgi:hypothetical protein
MFTEAGKKLILEGAVDLRKGRLPFDGIRLSFKPSASSYGMIDLTLATTIRGVPAIEVTKSIHPGDKLDFSDIQGSTGFTVGFD